MTKEKQPILQEGIIASKIVILRDEKVILDVHLAELYEVETRVLKQAVRRNIDRFPDDFMYQLTDAEIEDVVSQNVIPSKRHLGGAIPIWNIKLGWYKKFTLCFHRTRSCYVIWSFKQ